MNFHDSGLDNPTEPFSDNLIMYYFFYEGVESTPQELDLADPWQRLQYVYENCNVKQLLKGHYIKYDAGGKMNVCGIGWALHCAGFTDEEMKTDLICQFKNSFNPKSVYAALKEYGFTKAERRKIRVCPMPNCTRIGTLQGILEHLNEPAHAIPIRNIGKLIPLIRNSTKPKPTLADMFVSTIKDFKELF